MADGGAIGMQDLSPADVARSHLVAFQCGASRTYRPGLHHHVVGQALMEVDAGRIDRLMIEQPPRHGKTQQAGVDFPTWFLNRNPEKAVVYATYSAERAADVGTMVRTLQQSDYVRQLWPGNEIDRRSNAARRFKLAQHAGSYSAVGVGGPLTGRGADLLVMDDTIKDRVMADSPTHQRRAREWYSAVARTRLEPGARVVAMMCMVGETPVLMADGTERPIAAVRPGDMIASHDVDRLVASRVLNWKSQGDDQVYALKLKSGRVLRANERHPFLVDQGGVQAWVRLLDLRPGDRLVALFGGPCAACSARSMDARSEPAPRECATPITDGSAGPTGTARHRKAAKRGAMRVSATATASPKPNTPNASPSRAGAAPSVSGPSPSASGRATGTRSASTTITPPAPSAACCATDATLPLDAACRQKCLNAPLATYGFTLDQIVEIVADGRSEVFDIQVERTENFIANGVVSHNTRWSDNDLHGHIQREYSEEGWLTLRMPALATAGDLLGRPYGAPLWPERWTKEAMDSLRRGLLPRDWLALYQQTPAAGEGTTFLREWFRWYTPGNYPAGLHRYGASDYAVTEDARADFTEHGIAGMDEYGALWLIDGWSGQKTPDVWIEAQIDLAAAHRPLGWYGESGVIRNATEPGLLRRAREREVGLFCIWLPPIGDKAARAASFAARAAQGLVWVPRNDWGRHVVDQLCAFPGGRHDDAVDMCGLWGRAIDMILAARAGKGQQPAGIVPFSAQWLEYQEQTNANRIF